MYAFPFTTYAYGQQEPCTGSDVLTERFVTFPICAIQSQAQHKYKQYILYVCICYANEIIMNDTERCIVI